MVRRRIQLKYDLRPLGSNRGNTARGNNEQGNNLCSFCLLFTVSVVSGKLKANRSNVYDLQQ